jgi:TolA-binding protein
MTDQGWHLDKRVPISIIAVLVAQFAAGVWMVANMNGTIQRNTADITRLERSLETMATASQIQAVQLGRIEEQVGGLRGDIQRLLNRLETAP